MWTLLSPDERSEEPPAENAVLDFEDMDKLHAHDLDKITAWMESMLASLCQLGNVRVSVFLCLCWMPCDDYACCLPVLSTTAPTRCAEDNMACVAHMFPCTVAHSCHVMFCMRNTDLLLVHSPLHFAMSLVASEITKQSSHCTKQSPQ